MLMSALLVGGASTFVSCKDYDGEQAAVSNASIRGLQEELQKQIAALEALKSEIDSKLAGKADKTEVDQKIAELDAKIDRAVNELKTLIAGVSECKCDLTELLQTQAWILSVKNDLTALLQKNLVTVDQISDFLTKDELAKLGYLTEEDIKGFLTKEDLEGLLTPDDLKELKKMFEDLQTLLGPNLENVITKANIYDYCKIYFESDEANAILTNQILKNLNDLFAATGLTPENIEQLKDLLEQVDQLAAMSSKIQELESKATELDGKYGQLNSYVQEQIQKLWEKVNNAGGGGSTVYSPSINLDMVSNHIYGTLNSPFGLKSYVLAGFVGDAISYTKFHGEKIGGSQPLASSNAGKLYLTVNPIQVNASGYNIGYLVGRDGNKAPGFDSFVLQADDTPVTMTSTKASNGLGGYVAEAKLVDPAAAKININKDDLADVARNVLGKLRGEEALDITGIAKTIYGTVANSIDQLYGLYIPAGEGHLPSVSEYNIAAMTIKPLSYATLEGSSVSLKTIPQLEDFLGIHIDDIKNDFIWNPIDVDNSMDVEITIELPDPESFRINGTIPTPSADVSTGVAHVDGEGNIIWDSKPTVTIGSIDISSIKVEYDTKETTYNAVVTIRELQRVVDQINDQVGGMMDNANNLLDKVQGGIDKVNKGVVARLNSVIAKTNKILDNPNTVLQPVLLYADGNGAGRISESPIAPTRLNLNGKSEASILFVATSYSAELLAPAYKKYISVEGQGASFDQSGVIDGATNIIRFTAKPGKYTIKFDAVDYYGEQREKTYYVEVK